ncbi:MAG TPA: coenzyme F420-0:L-glutamate ligase [Candidatus Sabulitectum sp.]|nr:coenzyme F420-0:L-glutamate ligase [Candidatus Sabulitectum sp.]HPR23549.1 coenzyme F420-0:L-glutamate ligase [Candidatus Sabulitectum sp.]
MNKKEPVISLENSSWLRIPIRTQLILRGDDLISAVEKGLADAGEKPRPDDILFVSEKAVGASQGRYFVLGEDELRVRPLARFLSRFVTRTPAGIGLGMPETMECALRECGAARILFAAMAGGFTRMLGRRGDFYRIAGPLARSIDGPTRGTIPPFDNAVSLAPLDPDGVAKRLAGKFSCRAAVVDVNDLGGNILGAFPADLDRELLVRALSDNPLGQGTQGTPVGILRKL